MKFWIFLWGLSMASRPVAGPWEDSFLGVERSAHQDTLGQDGGRDLFSAAGNPAWVERRTKSSGSVSYHKASVGSRAAESPEVVLAGMGLQLARGPYYVGMLMVLPFLDSAVVDTGRSRGLVTPWTARNRQVQLQPYLGKSFLSERLTLGMMLPVSFDVKSETELRLDASEPTTRTKAGMDPNLSWGLGLTWKWNERATLSLAYRDRKESAAYVNVDGAVPVSGGPSIDIVASGSAPYIYEPRRSTLQWDYTFSSALTAGLWARFNQWEEMPAPVLTLRYTSPNLRTVTPDFRARNTVEVGAGAACSLREGSRLYASYRYSPTPFRQSLLFYDRNTHHLGAGWAYVLNAEWKAGIFGRLSLLEAGGIYSYFGTGVSLNL